MIRARKSLGQNFLTDRRVAGRIIDAVAPLPSDIILEIGPGTGALTRLLIGRAGLVVAIEIDPRLVAELRGAISSERLAIIEADAMKVDLRAVLDEAKSRWKISSAPMEAEPRIRVVANLPYYVSTPILERLLRLNDYIYDLTLMLQKEVVDRIVSSPGSRERGYFSVFVQYYCEARRLFVVPPSAFKPAPKVHSAIINLKVKRERLLPPEEEDSFFTLVRAAFSKRRKTILNSLKSSAPTGIEHALRRASVDPRRRAETLTLEEFRDLFEESRESFDESRECGV